MAPGNALTHRLMHPRPQTDVRRFAFELPARAESVARARALIRERLVRWGVHEDTRDTTALVVSELVTNAVVHTASDRVVCELRDNERRLRVAVHDEGGPVLSPQVRDVEECGRGLLLVEAVSSAWGAHDSSRGTGRVVWAELPHALGTPTAPLAHAAGEPC
ncbi:ATP-binding protein [Streptomyces sp. NPDC001941]|uniref:ATP-binding protein n=1 Tax=Streptomyces sp. NPDC001941 TaxID=3154659 RepID=UPI00332C7ECF